ncbi:MAG: aldehyde dehydrogenase family protein [bacterium]
METYPIIIGGEKKLTDKKFSLRNPFDNREIAEICVAGDSEIESAIKSVVLGFEIMKESTVRMRVGWLNKAAKLLEERKEDFARIISMESGKTIREARGEVSRSCETIRLSAIAAEEYMGGKVLPLEAAPNAEGKWGFCKRFPAGPVLAITPFNFPLNLAVHKVAPATAVGNSFILKPASSTPISGLMLGDLFIDAGVPKEAVSVLIGPGGRVAEPIASNDAIKVVTFTGSPAVGQRLAKIAGMKHFAFELGSNSGVYVDSDADIMTAASRITTGAFALAGQVCISTQRAYIHRDVYDEFIELLLTNVRALKIGDPSDELTDVGPMITSAEAERIELWVNSAIEMGGKLLIGGKRNGTIFEPTVLANVPSNADIVAGEAFGPVLVVQAVDSTQEGFSAIDRSIYGLQAGIFTSNIYLAKEAFDKIDVGGVIINDIPTWRADMIPYGGNKLSGIGREGPEFALEHMTVWKSFIVQTPLDR